MVISGEMRNAWWPGLGFDVLALVLAAMTWFAFSRVDAFENLGDQLIHNPSFQEGLSAWRVSAGVARRKSGAVDLSSHGRPQSHVISQTLDRPDSGDVRVTVDADIRGVVRGPEAWQSARIDVMGLDAHDHEHWDFPHKLVAVTGSRRFRDFSRVFKIPPEYKRIRVEAELVGATGTFVLQRLSAIEVRPIQAIGYLKQGISVLWIFFIASVVIALIWQHEWNLMVALLPGGALLLFIPSGFRHFIAQLMTFNGLHLALDHLALFIVMTWIALRGGSRQRAASIVHLAVLGVIVEAIQYYLPGRYSEFMDILSDWLGIAFGLMAFEIVLRLRRSGQVVR